MEEDGPPKRSKQLECPHHHVTTGMLRFEANMFDYNQGQRYIFAESVCGFVLRMSQFFFLVLEQLFSIALPSHRWLAHRA